MGGTGANTLSAILGTEKEIDAGIGNALDTETRAAFDALMGTLEASSIQNGDLDPVTAAVTDVLLAVLIDYANNTALGTIDGGEQEVPATVVAIGGANFANAGGGKYTFNVQGEMDMSPCNSDCTVDVDFDVEIDAAGNFTANTAGTVELYRHTINIVSGTAANDDVSITFSPASGDTGHIYITALTATVIFSEPGNFSSDLVGAELLTGYVNGATGEIEILPIELDIPATLVSNDGVEADVAIVGNLALGADVTLATDTAPTEVSVNSVAGSIDLSLNSTVGADMLNFSLAGLALGKSGDEAIHIVVDNENGLSVSEAAAYLTLGYGANVKSTFVSGTAFDMGYTSERVSDDLTRYTGVSVVMSGVTYSDVTFDVDNDGNVVNFSAVDGDVEISVTNGMGTITDGGEQVGTIENGVITYNDGTTVAF